MDPNLDDEARRQWNMQYLLGKDLSDFRGFGGGEYTLISPQVEFIAPFAGWGHLEIKGGSGGMRLCSGPGDALGIPDTGADDLFLLPWDHVEQVVIVPDPSSKVVQGADDMLRVFIIPTGATGASAVTKQYPQIVQFKWPNRRVIDSSIRGTMLEMRDLQKETYFSILRTALDEELGPLGKGVLVYTQHAKTVSKPPLFNCSGTLSPVMGTFLSEKSKGSLLFLPSGIIWLADTVLYLPFNSLNSLHLLFIRDAASATDDERYPVVSMGLVLSVTEPFYEAQGHGASTKTVHFTDIEDFSSVEVSIQNYSLAHGINFMKLEQTFYDYAQGQMMTGFMPFADPAV
ncbi:hypothetical protein B0J13DRAFT_569402 [Dactylonectria estremocensis]|uniref:Uncharacterized protein n=1 Tax=Dactylonectria estremocensis TaxID=1079267 RepID=A0A9P9DGJ6_9HYPO|nr:hypothetical protein B0J13DRAFT_569402 [Dactylonectria estremocensis]